MTYQYINPEYLDSVSAGDTGIVKELVDMFRSQIKETQNEMKFLLNKKDYNSLGLLAHKAKSSVLIMGMKDLGSLLKTFELQAREGLESHKYESYINRFTHETSEAVKELEDLVNKRLIKNE
ncbi:MAG: Hpt domain-containing protein [Bacteroidales bacterium]|nr:Hpt domain-containing protein [Bacteroidales bacterium]